jgi:methylmalonyl-CoA mutase
MTRPDFSKIDWDRIRLKPDATEMAAGGRGVRLPPDAPWMTGEHVEVKPRYTPADVAGLPHLEYAAGLPPFLRGP